MCSRDQGSEPGSNFRNKSGGSRWSKLSSHYLIICLSLSASAGAALFWSLSKNAKTSYPRARQEFIRFAQARSAVFADRDGRAYVFNVYVAPAFRGRGVADEMADAQRSKR